MSRSNRYNLRSDADDYRRGYADGMKAAFEETELDAYYAGVGYGKKNAKDSHIGFNNAEERRQFEKGIKNKDNHFNSYRAEKPGFFERLFGINGSRRDSIDVSNRKGELRKSVKRTASKRKKNAKKSRKGK